jgi:hypothetical protein
MQIKIPRNDLNHFKDKAVNIETNTTIPILSYIKFEISGITSKIIKNNLKEFVIGSFPESGNNECSYLVLENTLFEFLEHSDSKFLQFELGMNKIKIFDNSNSVESPTERAQDFIDPDFIPITWTKISRDTLESIGIASKFIFSNEIEGEKSKVFVKNGYVAGTDGIIGFYAEMIDNVPDLVFQKNIAGIISKLKYCEYSTNKNYDYFREDLITFGFPRTEFSFINFTPLFGEIKSDFSFHIHKKSLITFCDLCANVVDSKKVFFPAIFYSEDGSLMLTMEGSDKKIKNNLPLNGHVKRFKFNPERMKVLLKALPSETVYFYPGENRYFVTDARKSFLSVIMGFKL